jgi:hypothetical protein
LTRPIDKKEYMKIRAERIKKFNEDMANGKYKVGKVIK